MHPDHFFDWEGFAFLGKTVLLCVVIGAIGYLGISYAGAPRASLAGTPSLILIQEMHPAPTRVPGLALSTTTPERIIAALTIRDAVPPTGKFIAADLQHMILTLYQDGAATAKFPILVRGKIGSRCENLSGFYNVLAKEQDHVSTAERISLPWSIQFSGNYFIHGFPEYADHTRITAPSMSDCIRMATDDAKKAYDFADSGTPLFVYDPPPSTPMPSLVLGDVPVPHVSAASYLVADMDTNEVFLEQHAQDPHAIASVTKLMTALVANETIPSGENVDIPRSELLPAQKNVSAMQETFFAGDLLYPLLMQANAAVADSLAEHYGTNDFVAWMNTTAERLGMQSTHFADASGASAEDRSAPDDLYRLATYIADRDSFVLAMLRTPNKKLIAASGNAYSLSNANIFSDSATLIGGKASKTATTTDTMVSLFSMPLNNETRRVAIIVLASNDATADTTALADWVAQSVQQGALMAATACVSCVTAPQYRKIQW